VVATEIAFTLRYGFQRPRIQFVAEIRRVRWLVRVFGVVCGVLSWAFAIVVGWHAAMSYATKPGRPSARRLAIVPSSAQLPIYTCVLVAHPLCPCTRASLLALRSIAHEHDKTLRISVVFTGSERGRNWTLALQIPHVEISEVSLAEAESRYDAHTSGQTYIFDPGGRMAFSGGITPMRGDEDLQFAETIFDQVLSGKRLLTQYPVYGCSLRTENQ
jgi:hypothetical protein